MKIGTKLTIQFTGIVGVILGVVLISIYSLSALNSQRDFYDKLEERAYAAANIYLEQDEVTKERYAVFQKKYLQTLPEEIIQVFDDNDSNAFIEHNTQVSYPKSILAEIRNERTLRYAEQSRQIVGIYYEDNQGRFVILASAIDTSGYNWLKNLRLILLLSFLASLAIVYFAGRFFSRRALNPMRNIVKEVKAITASNLHHRVSEGNGRDELAELAITFNDTLKRLERAFETQKTFVSNASHELRTPLTAIIGEIEVLLSRDREKTDYTTGLSNVLHETEHLKDLANMLLSLAQTDLTEANELLEEIRLDELLWEVRQRILDTNPGADISIAIDDLPPEPEGLSVHGNRRLLSSALSNVIENAVKFSDHRRVKCLFRCTPETLNITVSDTGIGIAEENLKNIFQPFFRGENARRFIGHGIGLALAEKIIRLHGGTVSVTSTLDVGTEVSISLPVSKI